jgi:2-C-methyl-D-erythritol 4-phosphate cytidylyltransferase
MMSRVAVVLPAAGKSSRFVGFQRRKPFVELKGRPVWIRTAEHFLNRSDVVQTVLVVDPDELDWFRETFRANLAFLDITVVAGGNTRMESVRNGVRGITGDAQMIAVHDAARPLLTAKWIDEVFAAASQHGAAIPGLAVSSTVKRLSESRTICETVDRNRLVLAQTPQVFHRTILEQALRLGDVAATDEACLVERLGVPVHVVEGWPMNIKITTAEDFRLAELFLTALAGTASARPLHPFADEP